MIRISIHLPFSPIDGAKNVCEENGVPCVITACAYLQNMSMICPHICFDVSIAVDRSYEASLVFICAGLSAVHPFLKALLGLDRSGNVYFYFSYIVLLFSTSFSDKKFTGRNWLISGTIVKYR